MLERPGGRVKRLSCKGRYRTGPMEIGLSAETKGFGESCLFLGLEENLRSGLCPENGVARRPECAPKAVKRSIGTHG